MAALEHLWKFWARPSQLAPPGEWTTWLLLAGRGFGKNRTAVEYIRSRVEGPEPLAAPAGAPRRIALIAEDQDDARFVMVEGEAGILRLTPRDFRPHWEPSKKQLKWPNGIVAFAFSGADPEGLRGPSNALAWADELCKWRYPRETWDNLQFTLRLGERPRQIVTTTPKPNAVLREILSDANTVVSRGTTYENWANLAPKFRDWIVGKYEGTRLGRQELGAELLEDVPGALWQRALIEDNRVKEPPELVRIVVAIDPAASSGEDADETGIVVAGVDARGHGYVIEDLTCRATPNEWGARAVAAYRRWAADRVVAEVNQGGDMVEHVIRAVDPGTAYKSVHASRGKVARAEPVAALDEQGRIHHVGAFPELEDQMCLFTSDYDRGAAGFSPDRVDARVWAFTELMLGPQHGPLVW